MIDSLKTLLRELEKTSHPAASSRKEYERRVFR